MAAVRQKDTAPEMSVRRLLHAKGFRYRLHVRNLPGCPDLVFPGRQKVIFVHGCFWHGHACRRGRIPDSNVEFWTKKISTNKSRDAKAVAELKQMGWEICVVWQCQIHDRDALAHRLIEFLDGTLA